MRRNEHCVHPYFPYLKVKHRNAPVMLCTLNHIEVHILHSLDYLKRLVQLC